MELRGARERTVTVAEMMAGMVDEAMKARDSALRELNAYIIPLALLRERRARLQHRLIKGREDAGKVFQTLPEVLVATVEERLCALDEEIQALDLAAAPLRVAVAAAEARLEAANIASWIAEEL
jgi:hypothetical protein